MRAKNVDHGVKWCLRHLLPIVALCACPLLSSQSGPASPAAAVPSTVPETPSIVQWEGMPVRGISFEGVAADRLRPFPEEFTRHLGAPLTSEWLQQCLRELFATSLYATLRASAVAREDGVAIVFSGEPRRFIGVVTVAGAKGANMNTLLLRASQLSAGTRFTNARVNQAEERIRQSLAQNGFHLPTITCKLTPNPAEQLVDIAFSVSNGPQARVGAVAAVGDPGMSADEFRRRARLKEGERVQRDTANRSLAGLLKHYQKQDRFEAEIKLESQHYVPNTQRVDFRFLADHGPQVRVLVEGVAISPEHLRRVIPIFEEGTVNEDLLNEGNRRLLDYCQRLGYFDATVEHEQKAETADQLTILFTVKLGQRHRIARVSVTGNSYFGSPTLKELLTVRPASATERHGAYSQAMVAADIGVIEAVYRNNGFPAVKVTSGVVAPAVAREGEKVTPLDVVYHIAEGRQVRVGAVKLEGIAHSDVAKLSQLLNTAPGQVLSPQNLTGDRDALLTDYLGRGFDQVTVDIRQEADNSDPHKMDVTFDVHEGQQIFVRKVLLTGLEFTKPDTIAKAIVIHAGDPLSQIALSETQRNLYEFALFSGIDTAVENPNGGEKYKTILLQVTEARRWALSYGFGFEAQTGTPQTNCKNGCAPNGTTNVSPRVLLDVTRNGLFGRDQSASLRATYGLLEQRFSLLFQNPHFRGSRNVDLALDGGYANSRDLTTYVASRLESNVRWTLHVSRPSFTLLRASTFIYEYDFRRVKVAADSLQVYPGAVDLLSTAVRVTGPGLTWIRDTRDSALDAHRGTYTSFQEFLSGDRLGAQAQFNRIDLSNSSYYGFDKDRFVLARNTRYGQERASGSPDARLLPLPERLYAGGPSSLRGFSFNAAGPRDPQTGFPIGGAGALVNSTEMRLPPPTLPWLGDTVSFVLFHDMGNIFANASDAWPSALRIRQPNQDSCRGALNDAGKNLDGPESSIGPLGNCNYNYFTHTAGLGLRYHTPVGPIRFDFSYNLNPPIYPVLTTTPASMGQAAHFNFFFSLGQTF